MKYLVVVFLVTFFMLCSLAQADYYVDFENGVDTNDGLSTTRAWKHCPGDPNAGGNVISSYDLQPGDTVLFKGGVFYRGSVNIRASGTEGSPITYKGDDWPGLEGVKAILDGSELITDWTSEGGESPLWYAYATGGPNAGADVQRANLFQDDEGLYSAQSPNLTDPFFWDYTGEYWTAQSLSSTQLSDPRLAVLGGESLVENGYVYLYADGNHVDVRKISGYDDTGTPTIYFSSFTPYSDPSMWKYSIANALTILDRPGEFVFNEIPEPDETHKIYLWPIDDKDPNTADVTISVRDYGINLDGSYVTIEGLKIQRYAGKNEGRAIAKRSSVYRTNIIIRNNEITGLKASDPLSNSLEIYQDTGNTVIENNYIHDNIGQRGVLFQSSDNATIKNNTIYRQSGSVMLVASVTNGKIIDNYILDSWGRHGNAMALYNYNNNILVAGNVAINSKAFTIQLSSNIYYVNNIVNPKDSSHLVVSIWSGISENIVLLNNVLVGSTEGSAVQGSGYSIVKNNIMNDFPSAISDRTHNIYTSYRSGTPGEGDIIERDLTKIFLDPDNDDYRLTQGSPAIDAGTDVSAYLPIEVFPKYDFFKDIAGDIRPQGAGWDIGAYEYPAVMPTPTPTGSPTPSLTPTPTPTPTPADTTPPSIVSVMAQETSVNIVFDEPLDSQSAQYKDNYSISNDISIDQASLGPDLMTVTLATSSHTNGVTYTLTVRDVQDISGHAMPETTIYYVYRDDVTDGLVAHWKLDEGAGTIAKDSSDNGHDGTLINGPVWTGGRINYALDFDGSNDKVTIPHHNDLDPESITVAAWIFLQQSKTWNAILSKDEQVSYWLGVGVTTPLFLLSPDGSSGGQIRFWADSDITLYNWHHIAATYDGNYVQLYIDGSSSGSPQGYNGGIYQGTSPVLIGDTIIWQTYSNTFNGIIDDVRIYNRALSQEEIQAIYDAAPVAPLPQYTFDSSLEGWSFVGLDAPPDFYGASSSYTGGRLGISSAGDTTNRVGLWIGPLDIPCVAGNVYRARFLVSSSQATASANPQFRMRWIQDKSLESASHVVNPSGSYSNSLPTDPTQREYTIYFTPILTYNLGVAFDMVDFDAGQYGTHYVDQVTVERFPRPGAGTGVKTYTSDSDFSNWGYLSIMGSPTSGRSGGELRITSSTSSDSEFGMWQSSGTANELTYVADKLYRATYTLRCATDAARNDMPQIRLRCQNEDAQLTQTMELNSQGAGGPGAMPEVGGTDYEVYWETPILPSSPTTGQDGFFVAIDMLDFDALKGGTIYMDSVAIDYLTIP